jgi:hypothetical protein
MSHRKLFQNQISSIGITCELESLSGKIFEMEDMFSEIEIVEEVTNFTTAGSIAFTDTLSLKEFLPILGGERLRIKFQTDDKFDWYEKEFIITKLGREVPHQGRNKTIQLYFTSEEMLTNQLERFSKSYRNKTVSDILTDVFNTQLKSKKTLTTEGTSNSLNFIIPYWTPFETIRFLMKKGISSSTKDSGYLFFEDKNGFNFKSISGIFNQKSEKDIIMHRMKNEQGNSLSGFVGLVKYSTVLKTIDLIEDVRRGVTGGSAFTFDYATKSFMMREMEWEKFSDKTGVAMGKSSVYKDGFVNKGAVMEEFTGYINDRVFNDIDFPNSINDQTKVHLRNKNLYHGLNSNALVIGKSGDSELTCGALVKVEHMSGIEKEPNEKMYGNYLVKSLKHKITQGDGYEQVCLLTKPFYGKDPQGLTKTMTGRTNR